MTTFICLEKNSRIYLLCLVIGLLASCGTQPVFELPQTLPEPTRAGTGSSSGLPEEPRVVEQKASSQQLPVLEVSGWDGGDDERWKRLHLPSGKVDLNVDAMPLNEFIHVALGDVLGLSFNVDTEVSSRSDAVTLRVSKPVSATRLLGMVEQALAAYQVGLAWNEDRLQVLPASKLLTLPPLPVSGGADISLKQGRVMTIIPLHYSKPGEVLTFSKHFLQMGNGADIYIMQRLNALMVVGEASRIERFKSVIDMVDRPAMAGRRLHVIKPVYWQASEIAPLLKDALELQGVQVANTAAEGGVFISVINQLNSVLVAVPNPEILNWLNGWIEQLDTVEVAGESLRSFVYRVKHSTAKDLGMIVGNVIGDITREKQDASESIDDRASANTANTSSDGKVGKAALRLVVDEIHNSLVFIGSAQAYKTTYQLLQQLDVPAKQVLIEVTVADISLDNVKKLGVEWLYRDTRSNGVVKDIGGTLGGLSLGSAGFFYEARDPAGFVRARLNALVDEGDAKILSSPKLLAVDNEEARIQVGTQVAVLTQAVDNDNTSGLLQNFTYVDTGVILSFVPTVMANGVVRLKINQEVSSAGASINNTPPISKRSIETTLVAQSGSTVMIGGLITSNKNVKDLKVPGLGDIPLLGQLFRSRETTDNSTEMIVLITPHVIETPLEAEALTEAYRAQLEW